MAQAVSTYWRNQRGVRELVGRVELVNESGVTVRSTDLESEHPITVYDAKVSYDRTRNIWGSASCTILIPWDASQQILDLLPTTPGAPLTPIGGISFRISAGFRYPSIGVTELVYCGRFDIEECEVSEDASGVLVDLSGDDLLGRIDVADMIAGFDMAWGNRVIDAAKILINGVIPWMTFEEDPTITISGRWAAGERSNRLQNVRYMMAVLGFEAFMSMDGTSCRMRRRPSTQDAAAWVYPFDQFGEVIKLSSSMSRANVFNLVVAEGENPNTNDVPVRALAWVDDISDPTHYIPTTVPPTTQIGPRIHFIRSPWILTDADAQNAANVELERVRGLLQKVQLTIAVNPAINVGDIIDVSRPGIGIVGRYLVEALSFQLDSSLMTLTCEERRIGPDF